MMLHSAVSSRRWVESERERAQRSEHEAWLRELAGSSDEDAGVKSARGARKAEKAPQPRSRRSMSLPTLDVAWARTPEFAAAGPAEPSSVASSASSSARTASGAADAENALTGSEARTRAFTFGDPASPKAATSFGGAAPSTASAASPTFGSGVAAESASEESGSGGQSATAPRVRRMSKASQGSERLETVLEEQQQQHSDLLEGADRLRYPRNDSYEEPQQKTEEAEEDDGWAELARRRAESSALGADAAAQSAATEAAPPSGPREAGADAADGEAEPSEDRIQDRWRKQQERLQDEWRPLQQRLQQLQRDHEVQVRRSALQLQWPELQPSTTSSQRVEVVAEASPAGATAGETEQGLARGIVAGGEAASGSLALPGVRLTVKTEDEASATTEPPPALAPPRGAFADYFDCTASSIARAAATGATVACLEKSTAAWLSVRVIAKSNSGGADGRPPAVAVAAASAGGHASKRGASSASLTSATLAPAPGTEQVSPQELAQLKALQHPNLSQLVELYESELFLFAIHPRCERSRPLLQAFSSPPFAPSTASLLPRPTPAQSSGASAVTPPCEEECVDPKVLAAEVARQLLSGLSYCHARGFVHRRLCLDVGIEVIETKAVDDPPCIRICDVGLRKASSASGAAAHPDFSGTPPTTPAGDGTNKSCPGSPDLLNAATSPPSPSSAGTLLPTATKSALSPGNATAASASAACFQAFRWGSTRGLDHTVPRLLTTAPEALRDASTSESDVWSVGAITHLLLTGRLVFAEELAWEQATPKELLRAVQMIGKSSSSASSSSGVANGADANALGPDDFCRRLLAPNPQGRPDARAAARHAWLAVERWCPRGTVSSSAGDGGDAPRLGLTSASPESGGDRAAREAASAACRAAALQHMAALLEVRRRASALVASQLVKSDKLNALARELAGLTQGAEKADLNARCMPREQFKALLQRLGVTQAAAACAASAYGTLESQTIGAGRSPGPSRVRRASTGGLEDRIQEGGGRGTRTAVIDDGPSKVAYVEFIREVAACGQAHLEAIAHLPATPCEDDDDNRSETTCPPSRGASKMSSATMPRMGRRHSTSPVLTSEALKARNASRRPSLCSTASVEADAASTTSSRAHAKSRAATRRSSAFM
eukprot:TRINITY_DN17862_c2_g1_i1.p1 TRINITY_DN17862_c2_g1~~TRINITY_DN17862_c2_g1_i1.p1  ORF type:complete len:1149 (-),score=228.59 TRINITY_DN17862_c2_g1_i1:108-3500(-)